MNRIIPSKEIYKEIEKGILKGTKTPHITSMPILMFMSGRWLLETHTTLYQEDDIKNNVLPKPTYIEYADINTGNIVQEWNCQTDLPKDPFRFAEDGQKFDISPETQKVKATPEYRNSLFALLDIIRITLQKTDKVPYIAYLNYLCGVQDMLPAGYKQFFTAREGLCQLKIKTGVAYLDIYAEDNNVNAYKYDGTFLWNISEIVKDEDAAPYTRLGDKDQPEIMRALSHNGTEYDINVRAREVVKTIKPEKENKS